MTVYLSPPEDNDNQHMPANYNIMITFIICDFILINIIIIVIIGSSGKECNKRYYGRTRGLFGTSRGQCKGHKIYT